MQCFMGHSAWEKVSEKFNASTAKLDHFTGFTSDEDRALVERVLHGFTVVEQRCKDCGFTEFTKTIGRTKDAV